MTFKNIFITTVVVTIIHFIFTSVASYYIAHKTGTQIGQIVAFGLIEMGKSDSYKESKEADKTYQDIKTQKDIIIENWKIPRLLISLPDKFIIDYFLSDIRKEQFNKVISKEITKEQFYNQGRTLEYVAIIFNSISFGIIFYLLLMGFRKFRR